MTTDRNHGCNIKRIPNEVPFPPTFPTISEILHGNDYNS